MPIIKTKYFINIFIKIINKVFDYHHLLQKFLKIHCMVLRNGVVDWIDKLEMTYWEVNSWHKRKESIYMACWDYLLWGHTTLWILVTPGLGHHYMKAKGSDGWLTALSLLWPQAISFSSSVSTFISEVTGLERFGCLLEIWNSISAVIIKGNQLQGQLDSSYFV